MRSRAVRRAGRLGHLLTRWALVVGPIGGLGLPLHSSVVSPILANTVLANVAVDTTTRLDTGDFAPQPRTYSQDTIPLACIGAATATQRVIQGSRAAQIQQASGFAQPQTDTLPQAVVTVARACGARFTLATTAPAALPDLFRLALWEMNDTLAQTVLARLVAQEHTPAGQSTRLLWGITQYVAAVPARVALAERAAAQIDSLGASAGSRRVQAHQALVDLAYRSADWPLVRRQGAQLLAVGRAQLADSGLDVLGKTYEAIVQVAWLEHPDSVEAMVTQLRADLSQSVAQHATTAWCGASDLSRNRAVCSLLQPPNTQGTVNWLSLPVTDTTPLAVLTTNLLGIQMHAPQTLPPLRADFWFAPPGGGTVDSLHPAPKGRVSLIYHVQSADCFYGCSAEQLLALYKRYGSQLAVTVVVDAEGYTILQEMATPEKVADSYRWFFQEYLKVPVTVAVRTLPVTSQKPAPDGRITYALHPPAYDDVYAGPQWVIVTNRQGEAVFTGMNFSEPLHVAHVVAHEVATQ